ncbi:hypothetical protein [Streptomyces cavernicola]|uniref:Uncharacterized protein n=1 Tax=Streptomyces cavernicola TaxID=3043613 RepID=A0ABT6SG04_9ACTN|nr:hypothetical protein [Streptomyces sp. B-S-A6]MDI3406211.1 hypothetical protein [Streptomyces sp. B-S-A6]
MIESAQRIADAQERPELAFCNRRRVLEDDGFYVIVIQWSPQTPPVASWPRRCAGVVRRSSDGPMKGSPLMASANSPLATAHRRPRVEYRQFLLADEESLPEFPSWKGSDRIVIQGDRGVLFRTAANDFYPDVSLEVWPDEPPRAEGSWEALEEAVINSQTGRVELREWDHSPCGGPAELGASGRFHLRAYCRGRAEAAARSVDEMHFEGVEEWLLQLWAEVPGA